MGEGLMDANPDGEFRLPRRLGRVLPTGFRLVISALTRAVGGVATFVIGSVGE
jgi:hypothetical protein